MTTSNPNQIPAGFLESLTTAYADLMKQQRSASNAFVRWPKSARRGNEFAWLCEGSETIFADGHKKILTANDNAFQSVRRMESVIKLNPYEKGLVYGYPYVVGRVDGISIRGPLFHVPAKVTVTKSSASIEVEEDTLRFNSLPFRSDTQSDAAKLRLDQFVISAPDIPVTHADLRRLCEHMQLDLTVNLQGAIDGSLSEPQEVRTGTGLSIVDAAAIFVAPKTNYFIHDDLETIGSSVDQDLDETVLASLLGFSKYGDESAEVESSPVYFPFKSNPSQRRVARLAEHEKTDLITVQGPPGTGKSLTIANVACHLVASGKSVLITSQKDKALDVVDQMLKSLDMPEMPMTLLRQERQSKRELIDRLNGVAKRRSAEETASAIGRADDLLRLSTDNRSRSSEKLHRSIEIEDAAHLSDKQIRSRTGFPKMIAKLKNKVSSLKLGQNPEVSTSTFGDELTNANDKILETSERLLRLYAEHQIGTAGRNSIRELRDLTQTLKRDQRNSKNFKFFEQLKGDLARAKSLISTLPCWIMTPDDVARLFPLEAGLFDVVIVDEASQCDLPSMFPVLYRAKKAVIVGDSKQMQAQRFAFTAGQVAQEAWVRSGVSKFDPNLNLDPSKTDLLQLAATRMDEEVMLDEHYRSLPKIIEFSNSEYYLDRLRIMRDADQKRVGEPKSLVTKMIKLDDAKVTLDTQENPAEAAEVIEQLREIFENPFYDDASIGVICLFEEQMRMVGELVAREFSAEEIDKHSLVVVNPDGFQGDERDVIVYSLSYDANIMPRRAIAARQSQREHIQGMLNVAFTRARDEIRIVYSTDIQNFNSASGAIERWLQHCSTDVNTATDSFSSDPTDSDFEADVIHSLRNEGLTAYSQYPACGYKVDIVCTTGTKRIAIECDGEYWHHDEYGNLLIEDVDRQEILERAGWTVLRIPYRSWQKNPVPHLRRVKIALGIQGASDGSPDNNSSGTDDRTSAPTDVSADRKTRRENVTYPELHVIELVLEGIHDFDELARRVSKQLGYQKTGSRIKKGIWAATKKLERSGNIKIEEDEIFGTERSIETAFSGVGVSYRPYHSGRSTRYRRRW
jgi:very-short-patch-repair endonuclease